MDNKLMIFIGCAIVMIFMVVNEGFRLQHGEAITKLKSELRGAKERIVELEKRPQEHNHDYIYNNGYPKISEAIWTYQEIR